jgi:hypothetical protein
LRPILGISKAAGLNEGQLRHPDDNRQENDHAEEDERHPRVLGTGEAPKFLAVHLLSYRIIPDKEANMAKKTIFVSDLSGKEIRDDKGRRDRDHPVRRRKTRTGDSGRPGLGG